MAVSAVQHRSTAASNVSSVALAFASNNTASNLLVYGSSVSGTPTAATDNNTNTIANATSTTNCRVDYVASAHVGANTVTAHSGVATDMHLHIWEISGCTTTTPLRDSGVTSSTTASVSTAGSTSLSGDAVIGYFHDDPSADALVAGTGYSPSELSSNTVNNCALSEFKAATAGGTQTATCTGNAGDNLNQIVVVFIQASAGGPTVAQTSPAFYFDHEYNRRYEAWVSFDHGMPDADHGDFGGPPILDKGVIFGPPQYDPSLEHPSFKDVRWTFQQEPATDEGVIPPRLILGKGVIEFISGYDDHKESAPSQFPTFSSEIQDFERWTHLIILPGFNPALSYGQTDNLDDQKQQAGYIGLQVEYDDRMLQIVIPPCTWVSPDLLEHQIPRGTESSSLFGSDAGQDSTGFLILPPFREWDVLEEGQAIPANSVIITAPLPEDEFVGIPIVPSAPPPVAVIYGGFMYKLQQLDELEKL